MYTFKGYGARMIAKTLNEEKIPTKRGSLWAEQTVLSILKNSIYTGRFTYGRRNVTNGGREYKNQYSCEVSSVQMEKQRRFNTTRPKLNWKFITGAIVIMIVLGLAGLIFYQATRFNTHITINGIKVGSLTAEQATKKLEAATLKNKVYIGKKEIFDANG
jgi:hypothetical protein